MPVPIGSVAASSGNASFGVSGADVMFHFHAMPTGLRSREIDMHQTYGMQRSNCFFMKPESTPNIAYKRYIIRCLYATSHCTPKAGMPGCGWFICAIEIHAMHIQRYNGLRAAVINSMPPDLAP
jgi:hypothetical protein